LQECAVGYNYYYWK